MNPMKNKGLKIYLSQKSNIDFVLTMINILLEPDRELLRVRGILHKYECNE